MNISIQVATVPDRDWPVAELWMGSQMIAEISQNDDESLVVAFYSMPDSEPLALEKFLLAIDEAKKALLRPSAFTPDE